MKDPNEIYKKLSIPLLRNSDLHKAVHECMDLLKENMPADGMTIHLLEPSLKSNRCIVSCSKNDEFHEIAQDTIISIPQEIRSQFKKKPPPDARIINRAEADPIATHFIPFAGEDYSNMILFLSENGKRFGAVALVASGRDRYKQENLELFSLLKDPFTIALKYQLQRQEIVKLQNILSERDEQKK